MCRKSVEQCEGVGATRPQLTFLPPSTLLHIHITHLLIVIEIIIQITIEIIIEITIQIIIEIIIEINKEI